MKFRKSVCSQAELYECLGDTGYKRHRLQKIADIIGASSFSLLDVGCGAGQFKSASRALLPKMNYSGIDFSEGQVAVARSKGYNVKHHDITRKWPYKDNTFDVVFCSEIVEHILDTDFIIAEAYRVLKRSGRIIVTIPNVASLGDRIRLLFGIVPSAIENRVFPSSRGHIRAFNYGDLKQLLQDNGFSHINITGRDFYLPFIKYGGPLDWINKALANLLPKLSAGFIATGTK
ncbi:MAG: class I SAM-dependent methyltransferase [Nitrosarchaeum sp.]|nr:class I SAM-dependent methyltransferase [Nitrosarchaeum sp.]